MRWYLRSLGFYFCFLWTKPSPSHMKMAGGRLPDLLCPESFWKMGRAVPQHPPHLHGIYTQRSHPNRKPLLQFDSPSLETPREEGEESVFMPQFLWVHFELPSRRYGCLGSQKSLVHPRGYIKNSQTSHGGSNRHNRNSSA